jgi:hypothetical protein
VPQMVIERRSSPWQATSGAPSVRGKAPVSAGSLLGVVWKLALVGVLALGVWIAWEKTPGIWSSIRLNSDVESASVFFVREIPRNFASEDDLKRSVSNAAEEKLKSYLAYKARWYVAYGPRGDAMKLVRDDDFTTLDKAFISKAVEDARKKGDAAGTEIRTLGFPRGVRTRTVSVGGTPYYVVAGWTEEGK